MNETVLRVRMYRPRPLPTQRRPGVFTAVDGTLLDAATFDPGSNREAVRRLHANGVPVIPVTVMTLEEIAPLARELGLQHAMIVEAGGAIARWHEGAWLVESLGDDASRLLDVIREVEDRSGASLLVYSALPEAQAARLSGRSGEMLRYSTARRFSEPFVIEHGDVEAVDAAARAVGYSLRRGRRFFYLCRACDEGAAFARLEQELRIDTSIAVGGSPVDADWMRRAGVQIVVPGPDGDADPELLAALPDARVAPAPAPAGWAAALESALEGQALNAG